jgi:hypothetical protein
MLSAASSSFSQLGSGGSSSSGSIGKDMGPWMGQTWTWAWGISSPAIASPTFSGSKLS